MKNIFLLINIILACSTNYSFAIEDAHDSDIITQNIARQPENQVEADQKQEILENIKARLSHRSALIFDYEHSAYEKCRTGPHEYNFIDKLYEHTSVEELLGENFIEELEKQISILYEKISNDLKKLTREELKAAINQDHNLRDEFEIQPELLEIFEITLE